MNDKRISKKMLQILLVGGTLLFLVTIHGCQIFPRESSPTKTPEIALPDFPLSAAEPLSATATPTVTKVVQPTLAPLPSIMPSARVFGHLSGECISPTDKGQILYLRQNKQLDLYVMNGEACFQRLLMKDVSYPFVWSSDGKMIAGVCDDGDKICILDARATLDSCNTLGTEQACSPVIVQIIDVAEICSEDDASFGIYSISWSPDKTRIAIAYGRYGASEDNSDKVSVLSLNDPGKCHAIMTDNSELWVDWSPIDDRLVVSKRNEIFLVNPDGSHLVRLTSGMFPEWSPDGKKIAFAYLMYFDNEGDIASGILEINVDGTEKELLYVPQGPDNPDSLRYVKLGDVGYKKLLTWSPDGRYIAFGATYNNIYDSQIMRLDLQTGEIVLLSERMDPQYYYYAPDWGQ